MTKFVVSVDCIIEYAGKFLIIERPKGKHAGGLLSFPGGAFKITDGEEGKDALVQAVKREVFEEVGLKLEDPIRYVTSSCFVDTEKRSEVVHVVYHCKIGSAPGELQVCQREVPSYSW